MTKVVDADELIELAAIVRAHGLRGELLLKPFNPDSDLLFEIERVLVRSPSGATKVHEVESAHAHGSMVLYALKGIEGREEAEPLRGSTICIRRADLPPLEEGEFYFVDLVGAQVRDDQGREIGTVRDVLDYPSVCCFLITTPEGDLEIPNVDRYVLSLDVGAKLVTVSHIEELEALRATPKKEAKSPSKGGKAAKNEDRAPREDVPSKPAEGANEGTNTKVPNGRASAHNKKGAKS